MGRVITMEDGDSAYTLTRDGEKARLVVKGELTSTLARALIEDLTPLAGARKKAARPVKPEPPPKPPAARDGGG